MKAPRPHVARPAGRDGRFTWRGITAPKRAEFTRFQALGRFQTLSVASQGSCQSAVAGSWGSDPRLSTPEDFAPIRTGKAALGAVIGDLNQRRSHIQNVGQRGGKSLVEALVPLREMFGYSTELRSASQGRATFSMQFGNYDTLSG